MNPIQPRKPKTSTAKPLVAPEIVEAIRRAHAAEVVHLATPGFVVRPSARDLAERFGIDEIDARLILARRGPYREAR